MLARGLGEWEFDCIDAPHPASGPPQAQVAAFFPDVSYFQWWDAIDEADGKRYVGLQETVSYVASKLRRSRYDALLGFSQGAIVATLLTALKENGDHAVEGCEWGC